MESIKIEMRFDEDINSTAKDYMRSNLSPEEYLKWLSGFDEMKPLPASQLWVQPCGKDCLAVSAYEYPSGYRYWHKAHDVNITVK